jgi:serine/threonine protein phosphatase PrpC
MPTENERATRASRAWFDGVGESQRGKARAKNQDVILLEPELGLYAVFDGMGGARAGEVAAQLARETLLRFVVKHLGSRRYTPRKLLEAAIDAAATVVFTAANEHEERQGMGTTVVACLVADPTRIVLGYAGDSRAYVLRDGRLRLLTHDHTVVQGLLDAGSLTVEQAAESPYRSWLTRNLGMEKGANPDMLEQAVDPGDRLLLCSDGLHERASVEDLQRVLTSKAKPEEVVHNLIELALSGGGTDDISAVVLDVPVGPTARARARATTE